MPVLPLKRLLTAAAITAVTIGTVSAASAAPVTNFARHEERAARPMIQDVHWEWHHHHRVWVPDHHRYYR